MEADNKYNLTVGQRIREIRESGRMTRSEFGKKCGISESFLAAVESGKKSITSKTLYKICTAVDMSADYFIQGHKEGHTTDVLLEKAATMDKPYRESLARMIKEYVDVVCSQTQNS